MISFVRGILEEIGTDSVIIDKDGLGIQIMTTTAVLGKLPSLNSEITLYTHFHVKEDGMQLFGFLDKSDLKLFKLLITVNGVGPKAALSILSSLDADTLIFAILSEDINCISKAQGVGKKIAGKIILDIKDKVGLINEEKMFETLKESDDLEERANLQANKNEAIEALKALGYTATEALRAVQAVEADVSASSDEIIKLALKKMY